jgi:hypothetical protein
VAAGTLVPPDQASTGFPDIPGVNYSDYYNEMGEKDYGPGVSENRGVITNWHPDFLASYEVLVPKTDELGIDLDGVRVPRNGAPIATATGWNVRAAPYTEGDLCGLQGMYLPLPETRAEAGASGDPRPSLEELYGSHGGYVGAVAVYVARAAPASPAAEGRDPGDRGGGGERRAAPGRLRGAPRRGAGHAFLGIGLPPALWAAAVGALARGRARSVISDVPDGRRKSGVQAPPDGLELSPSSDERSVLAARFEGASPGPAGDGGARPRHQQLSLVGGAAARGVIRGGRQLLAHRAPRRRCRQQRPTQ